MDAVITYVNGTDKLWISNYNKYVKKPIEEARYRDWGTLPYLIKGIRKFMPFIDKIFLVVSGVSQVPNDIDLTDVRLVYHNMIIPERYLPCFNSCTIEMFLHNIPDLSNEFIYFNDDTFIIKYMKETDFFVDGKPVLNPHLITMSQFDTFRVFQENCVNSTKLIRDKFVPTYPSNIYIRQEHIMRPMLKSTYKKVWDKCAVEIYNSLTRTRHNRNCNAYLFNNYDYMTGNYVLSELNYKLIKTGDLLEDIVQCIVNNTYNIICLNDNSDVNYENRKYIQDAFCSVIESKGYEYNIKSIEFDYDNIESNKQENNSLKVALCAIAKNENLYIREWIEWYKNIGISKIFLYDNNDLNGERFDEVISDYINDGFVEIIDVRGVVKTTETDKTGETLQGISYKECYDKHFEEYDWMCFFDIDEFLEINDKLTINSFLNLYKDDSYDGIRVQWKMYGDNNLLYYDDRSVYERFYNSKNIKKSSLIKTILKCGKHHKDNLLFCAHGPLKVSGIKKQISVINLDYTEGLNPYRNLFELRMNLPAYLNHFYSKSTMEFIDRKWKQTSCVTGINYKRNYNLDFIKTQYFEYNKITDAKKLLFDNLINTVEKKQKDKNDTIIVNFTTWKKRDMYVPFLLKYFKNQTLLPDKIVCWLSYDEYNGVIPDSIKYCLENDLLSEVHFVEGNTYGHKRYETFKYNNSVYNIFIDDDIYYPIDYVELLYKECKENPNNVICYYSRHEMYEENGKRSFTDLEITPSFANRYFSGLAAFPPNLFPIESFKYSTLRDKYCKKCDDSWINGWLFRKKIKVKGIFNWGKKSPLNVIGNTQDDGIYETHNGLKINGIMQAAINIANAVTVTGTEKIANKIWPLFNISEVTTCNEVI